MIAIEEGVEGLIHVSELSWTRRITRLSDVLTVGQELEAVVLGVNRDEQKISLGVRQFEPNPRDEIEHRYPISKQVRGTKRNLIVYGAFVRPEKELDGMVAAAGLHHSENKRDGRRRRFAQGAVGWSLGESDIARRLKWPPATGSISRLPMIRSSFGKRVAIRVARSSNNVSLPPPGMSRTISLRSLADAASCATVTFQASAAR